LGVFCGEGAGVVGFVGIILAAGDTVVGVVDEVITLDAGINRKAGDVTAGEGVVCTLGIRTTGVVVGGWGGLDFGAETDLSDAGEGGEGGSVCGGVDGGAIVGGVGSGL
jgi:hypothetical protein